MAHLWSRFNGRDNGTRVPCFVCGVMILLAAAWIDVKGPAFKAYYCEHCHSEVK